MGRWMLLLLLLRNVNAFTLVQYGGKSISLKSEMRRKTVVLNKSTNGDLENSQKRRQLLISSLLAGTTATPKPVSATNPDTASDTDESVDSSTTFTADFNILKAPLDEREYEYLVLENGLRVILCHDESETRAACAMAVHVGATSDTNISGLAHFCEHMLFLGTQKYPVEDEFELYLQNHGGSSNAFTDSENTVYYFDIQADKTDTLSQAVDRFASFFAQPLFNEDAVQREVNAIDSEHAKNVQNDAFRLYQLDKYRVNKDHPYSRFFTGTRQTLLQKGPDYLRNQLLEFYKTYYSANQMILAIVAPQSLSTLKEIITSSCFTIPNSNRPPPELSWNQRILPYDETNTSQIPAKGYQLNVVPVKDLRQVTLSFPLLYSSKEDKLQHLLIKPEFYVTHLIGHEGTKSLLSFLKYEKEWANELEASVSTELSDFTTLEITVELTTMGLKNVNSVISAIFSYLQKLQKQPIPQYIYQEVLQLSELDWRFLTKGSPTSYVQSLVKSIYEGYEPSLLIAGPRRLALNTDRTSISTPRTQFDSSEQLKKTQDLVQKLIQQLTVDNALVTLVSQDFAGATNQVDPYYGTQYSVERIPMSTLFTWKFPSPLPVEYPPPNVFLPTEQGLTLKFPKMSQPTTLPTSLEDRWKQIANIEAPTTIRKDDRWTVYYKKDVRFGQPKAYIIFQLLNGQVYSSPKAAVLAQLYQLCCADKLEEYAYDAQLAGLSYDVNVLPRGVRCTFGGYNEKLLDFSTYILKKLSSVSLLPQTNQELNRYVDNYMRALKAFDVSQPYSHAIYYSSLTLQPIAFQYTNAQLRTALEGITRDDLVSYVKTLWSSGRVEALIQGNLYQEEAQSFVDVIDETLQFRTVQDGDVLPPTYHALPLPISTTPTTIILQESNPSNENAAVQYTLQCMDTSEKDHVLIELVSAIVNEPFYEELRTKQQLGYIVSSGVKAVSNTRILSFVVQSNQYNVEFLAQSITNFIQSVPSKYLSTLTNDKVDSILKSSILKRTEPDKNLAIEASRNWNEIATGRLQFDRLATEAKVAFTITKADIIQFWKKLTTQQPRMLLTQNIPQQGSAFSFSPPKSQGYTINTITNTSNIDKNPTAILLGVDDIEQFRRDRE